MNSQQEEQQHPLIKIFQTQKNISEDVVKQLDSLTSEIAKDQNSIKIWSELQNIDIFKFIETIFQYSQCHQTKVLILQVLKNQIKLTWMMHQPEEIRQCNNKIIRLLEDQIVKYSGVLDDDKEDIIKGFSQVICEILKLGNQLSHCIINLIQKALQDQIFCFSVLKLVNYLAEEVFSYEMQAEEEEQNNNNNENKLLKLECESMKDIVIQLSFYILDRYNENRDKVKQDIVQQSLQAIYLYTTLTNTFFPIERAQFILNFIKESVFRDYVLNCFNRFFLEQGNIIKNKGNNIIEEILKEISNVIPNDIDCKNELDIIQEQYPDQTENFIKMCTAVNNVFINYLTTILQINEKNQNNSNNVVELYNNDKQFKNILIPLLNYIERFTQLENLQLDNIDFWIQFLNQIKNSSIDNNQILQQLDEILVSLSYHLISNFSRPNICRVEISNNGDVTIENQVSNDETMFLNQKILLHLLLSLKYEQIHQIFIAKFEKLIDGSEWNTQNIECLQYALGAVAGGLDADKNKKFSLATIRSYLNLIETRRNQIAKVLIINSFLFTTSTFEEFLDSNKNILETVVKKIVDFITDDNPSVVELALYYLNVYCERYSKFFTTETKNGEIMFKSLANKSKFITHNLKIQKRCKFYESLILLINKCENEENKKEFFNILINPYINDFDRYLNKYELILEINNYLEIRLILEIMCQSSLYLTQLFVLQFKKYHELSELKLFLDQVISQNSQKQQLNQQQQQPQNENHEGDINYLIIHLRELITMILNHSFKILLLHQQEQTNPEQQQQPQIPQEQYQQISTQIVVSAKNIIDKYQTLQDINKDYSTINLIESCMRIAKKNEDIHELSSLFFNISFDISTTQQNNQKFRNFIQQSYSLLLSYSNINIASLVDEVLNQIKLNQKQIRVFLISGIVHNDIDIYIPSLNVLHSIIKNVNQYSEKIKLFYQTYLNDILKYIFQTSIDGYHNSGISIMSEILQSVFSIISKIKLKSNNRNGNEGIISSYILEKLQESIQSKDLLTYIQNKKIIQDLVSSWDSDFSASFKHFINIVVNH